MWKELGSVKVVLNVSEESGLRGVDCCSVEHLVRLKGCGKCHKRSSIRKSSCGMLRNILLWSCDWEIDLRIGM